MKPTANATYCNDGTNAEAFEIVFDPPTITYRKLLEFFFQIHDPITVNLQGNDRERALSAIFYTSEEQRQIANDTIADVNASVLWPGRVVTEAAQAAPFWKAELEHQDYWEHYPNGCTCHFVRQQWKLPAREEGHGEPVERVAHEKRDRDKAGSDRTPVCPVFARRKADGDHLKRIYRSGRRGGCEVAARAVPDHQLPDFVSRTGATRAARPVEI